MSSYKSGICDNPTAIIQPYDGPDPGYILAESDGGLSNRLRVLAAYMYVGEFNYQGAHLVFIWDINSACPGHFLELFQPINHVAFATNSSRYVFDKHAKVVYENSWAVFTWTLQMNNIPKNRFGLPTWKQIEHMMYSRFKPTKDIMRIVDNSAIHIRVTDLAKGLKGRKHINIDGYINYVESLPMLVHIFVYILCFTRLSREQTVYLLTDNPETQALFLERFGNKILVYEVIPQIKYKVIESSITRISISDMTDGIVNTTALQNNETVAILPEDHRFTSLQHTLIDVLIAAHAKEFKPAIYSSLSELVKMFSDIGRGERGWCR